MNKVGKAHINITLWHIHVLFKPPQSSYQPNTISLQVSNFMANLFCWQKCLHSIVVGLTLLQ